MSYNNHLEKLRTAVFPSNASEIADLQKQREWYINVSKRNDSLTTLEQQQKQLLEHEMRMLTQMKHVWHQMMYVMPIVTLYKYTTIWILI